MQIQDKVAIVTGGAVRLGAEIVKTLSSAGARVVIHCNSSIEEAAKLSNDLGKNRSFVIQSDLSVVDQAANIIDRTIEHFGSVDILINNAAIFYRTPWDEITQDDWKKFLDINFLSPFTLAQAAAKKMMHGKIINICGHSAVDPYPSYLAYSVSKAALLSATKGLAKALGPNIQTNSISPRLIHLPGDEDNPLYRAYADKIPDEIVESHVVVDKIIELIEDDSITGQDICI